MGKVRSFLGSVFGDDQKYTRPRNRYIMMLRGDIAGVSTKADADAILDGWATIAQDAWSADWITYEIFESDMDWASTLYDQALIRISSGGVPSGTTVDPYTGRWVSTPGPAPVIPTQPIIRPTSYTPWIIAGSVGLGIIGLFALRGRRRK
jgi:hypothetical protein